MAIKVDLPKEAVQHALQIAINSFKRASNSASNKLIKEAYEKDAREHQAALNTLTEVKG